MTFIIIKDNGCRAAEFPIFHGCDTSLLTLVFWLRNMFTGITTDIGEVIAVEPRAEGLRRLKVACAYPRESIAIGASISHSGVCLTVVETAAAGNRTAISVDA